jgi:hypothetical protein
MARDLAAMATGEISDQQGRTTGALGIDGAGGPLNRPHEVGVTPVVWTAVAVALETTSANG